MQRPQFQHRHTMSAMLLAVSICQMTFVCLAQDLNVNIHVETINGKIPLALAHLYGQTFTGPLTNMSTYELVRIDIENIRPDPRTLQVKLALLGLGTESIQTVRVGPMAKVVVRGSPSLGPKVISEVVDERAAKLSVQVSEGQTVLQADILNVNLAGKDDVPMYQGSVPLYHFLVTRVQPKSKLVNKVLSEAGQRRGLKWRKGIVGRQTKTDPSQMVEDIRKIYNTLQDMGFVFVNTPVSFEKGYQRIKTPTEAIRNRSGNCIDGTLVFASCISAIGYNPIIVVIPGHAFVIATCPETALDATRASRLRLHALGVKDGKPGLSTKDYTAWCAIETTTMQQRSGYTVGLTAMTVNEAMATGNSELQGFIADDKRESALFIDVEAWRHCGLLPSPDDQ